LSVQKNTETEKGQQNIEQKERERKTSIEVKHKQLKPNTNELTSRAGFSNAYLTLKKYFGTEQGISIHLLSMRVNKIPTMRCL